MGMDIPSDEKFALWIYHMEQRIGSMIRETIEDNHNDN